MNRTDLALERNTNGISLKESSIDGILLTEVTISGKQYTTMHSGVMRDAANEAGVLTGILKQFVPRDGKVLVAGLGNANITPDSLGVRTVRQVVATAHLSVTEDFRDLGMRPVYVTETGVLAQTGMESSEQLRFITGGIKPGMVIVIDSLACSEPERLGRTIQLTDSGIAPGSGVGNSRCEISRETLGTDVVAVGVPTVIDLSSLCPGIDKKHEAMVVPRDIDAIITHYVKVISTALNRVLIPSLSDNEVEKLRF